MAACERRERDASEWADDLIADVADEAVVTVDGARNKAMADQITTAAKSRLGQYLCTLDRRELDAVERAIKVQLGLH